MEINIFYSIFIYPVVILIEFIFVFSRELFKNTGISILCVSGVIFVLCLPLYAVSDKLQVIENDIQKRMACKIAKIKAVFKGDERHMILSAYYRQNNYNPIYALRNNFYLIIQIPFFFAAYLYLSGSETIQNHSFLFIKDLSSPDALFSSGVFSINILPFVMTVINIISGAVYTNNLPFKNKIQIYIIAVIFLILLYNSPSALVLYWIFNNIFSLFRNIYQNIPYKKKNIFIYIFISFAALLFSYYSIFIHHGKYNTRLLIAVISLTAGVMPWIIKLILPALKHFIFDFSKVTYDNRLFIFSLLTLWAAAGLLIPSMLIVSSVQEFSFIDNVNSPLFFIFNSSVQAFGVFVFWPLLLYFYFPWKIKTVFSIFAAVFSISALFNIFVFPGNYGTISGELVFENIVNHSSVEIIKNILFLLLISAILVLIYLKKRKTFLSYFFIAIFIAVFSFSVKNILTINKEYKLLTEYYTPLSIKEKTIEPVIQLSKTGENILIIMLDMAQSVFIPYIFKESPYLLNEYDGFIYYPNTVTYNGFTAGGAPPIYGGFEYTPNEINNRNDVSINEKYNEALLLMPKIFSEENFSVIVTDPPLAGSSWIPDLRIYNGIEAVSSFLTDGKYTDLWLERNNIQLPLQSEVLKRNILFYAIFREIPLAFRQAVYYTGSWCAPFSGHRMRLFLNGYAVLDFLGELTGFNPQRKNSAVIITNKTTHEKILLQTPEYKPQKLITNKSESRFGNEAWYHTNAAAVKRLGSYFNFLKNNGVYDNTRIILVSDHGCLDSSFVTKTGLPFHVDQFNPFLFIKDFNSSGKMKTDMSFMTNADVPFLAMNGIIDNPVNPFTGSTINSVNKNNKQLILLERVKRKNDNEIELNEKNTYYVIDNIFNENNWTKYP